jgi:hypothetical protein
MSCMNGPAHRAHEAQASLNCTENFLRMIPVDDPLAGLAAHTVAWVRDTDIVREFPDVHASYDVSSTRPDYGAYPPSAYWLQVLRSDKDSLPAHIHDMLPGIEGVVDGTYATAVHGNAMSNTQPLAAVKAAPLAVVAPKRHELTRAIVGTGLCAGFVARSLEPNTTREDPDGVRHLGRAKATLASAGLILKALRTPAIDESGATGEWLAEGSDRVRRACVEGGSFILGPPPADSMLAEAHKYDGTAATVGNYIIAEAVSVAALELGFSEEGSALKVMDVLDAMHRKA